MPENEKIDINGIAGAVAKELAKLKEDADKRSDTKSGNNESGAEVSESFVCPECGTPVKGMTTYCPGCGCQLEWEA